MCTETADKKQHFIQLHIKGGKEQATQIISMVEFYCSEIMCEMCVERLQTVEE